MARPLTIAISHDLGKAEARRRMGDAIGWFKENHGAMISLREETWTDDDVTFTAQALGYAMQGQIAFTDTDVVLTSKLPWLVQKLIAPFRKALVEQATELLRQP